MAVYLTASASTVAKNVAKQTALILNEAVSLPYFKAFESQLLNLAQLYQLLEQHIEQAVQQAGWGMADICQIPIFIGSTGYVLTDCEYRVQHNQPLPTEYTIANIGDYLRERYHTQVFSFATSCTSSAQGLNYAYKMLNNGLCDKALVIGFELFNRLTFEHFHSMHLLAQSESYQPFIEPSGIVLGEGIACLALSSQANNGFECEILGVTSLTDNDNLTNNSENALRNLLTQIVANAGISAEQICGIKPHAVGGNFDQTEMQLLSELFPNSLWILVKNHFGHTLGASGAVETAFLMDCLKAQKAPNLQKNADNLPLVADKCLENGYYLNYFLGFGGSNVGWVMKWTKR
ncbi:beta-ketoacyl synthase [Pasteurellaceae bacterium 15-036681]|nr:beta-ketoacyl synthase [Pasteurellaceae bacterium 15-036681]